MKVGLLLWLLAVAVAVIVGLAKFAGISVPTVTPLLMKDATLSLFIALALSIVARWL